MTSTSPVIAVPSMASAAEEAIAGAGLRIEDVDLLIPHQANLRIIDAVTKRLRLDPAKVFVNIQKYGNTSHSASDALMTGGGARLRPRPVMKRAREMLSVAGFRDIERRSAAILSARNQSLWSRSSELAQRDA